jgi:pimeloyl-ACP methyl ester carboxylesterase
MPQLVARGYTVLAPDLRGLGDTTKPRHGLRPGDRGWGFPALVAKLGLGTRVNIVGHDLGGMVAYAYAAQNPDEVRSLSILDVEMSAGDREKSDSPS